MTEQVQVRKEFSSVLAKRRNLVKAIKRAAIEHVVNGGTAQDAPKVIYFWGNNWAVLTTEHRRMLITEIILRSQDQQVQQEKQDDSTEESSRVCKHCGHPY